MRGADRDAIEQAVIEGESARVLDLCRALDDAARSSVSRAADALARRVALTREERDYGTATDRRRAQVQACGVLRLCVGPSDIDPTPVPQEWVEGALLQRSYTWREAWLARYPERVTWPVLRSMINAGACVSPADLDYPARMARAVGYLVSPYPKDRDVYRGLIEDPVLLRDDVCRIFEVDGLGFRDCGLPSEWDVWEPTLLRLEREGLLVRDRLLDAVLAGLRPVIQVRTAREFGTFHGRLKPTVDELAQREDVYLRLLEHPAKPAVALAVRCLKRLQRAGRLDGRAFLEHFPADLVSLPAPTAHAAVDLAGEVVAASPALASDGIAAALNALGHRSETVQDAALAITESHPGALGDADRTRLSTIVDLVDPAVRGRARALGRTAPAQSPVVVVPVPVAIGVDATAIPRLRDSERVTPVGDLSELLELTAIVLERQDDPVELERWCDGVARFCDRPISEGLLRPLQRRARKVAESGPRGTARAALSILAYHWLAGERLWRRGRVNEAWKPLWTGPGPHGAITQRLGALAIRAERRHAGPLLSAPTHRGGWIDPLALTERLSNNASIDDQDLAQAILRLGAEGADDALVELRRLPGEAALVVCAALGEPLTPNAGHASLPAAWDAVRVLRSPRAPQVDAPGWPSSNPLNPIGADSPKHLSPITCLTSSAPADTYPGDSAIRRWLQLVWPANREPYYASALILHRLHVHPWITQAQLEDLRVALEPLLLADEPFGPHATELLATALGSTPANRLAAADVLIEAITTRRIDMQTLASVVALEMQHPDARPDRWAEPLDAVAATGPLHAYETQQLIETILAQLGSQPLPLAQLVDLLRRLAQDADATITNASARAWLENTPAHTKLGTCARRALACTGTGAARAAAAAEQAQPGEQQQRQRWTKAHPHARSGTRTQPPQVISGVAVPSGRAARPPA
ncbi:MAG: DUF6493 family protein [Solirubrobacteraceae bacterium]